MNTSSLISRRRFLLAAAAPWLAGCASNHTPGSPGPRWRIGCYTRPWDQHDYRVALDSIAEAGFACAGIMTAKGRSWVMLTPQTTPDEAVEIHTQLTLRRLQAVSAYGDFKPGTAIADNVTSLRQLIDRCAECGSPDLLLGGTEQQALYEPFYRAVRECCGYAQTRHVRLTIKPHGGQNATGPQCRQAIDGVGHPNFRLWYDPGNIFYYSDGRLDPVTDAATVDGLVAGMSVKDFLPPKQVEVTPGTGRVDFPAVLARLRQGGFTGGPLVVECLARPDPKDVKAITREAKQARQFLEELTGQMA